jgi:UDP-N-acetylmuramoylalanine--D-glutamate ligase
LKDKLEEFKKEIKGKKIAALGIGRSNIPAIKYLKSLGALVTGFDKNESIVKECDELGIKYFLGEKMQGNLKGFDYIFRSPGIKPSNEYIQKEVLNGAILTSEIELLVKLCPCTVIGITGSDGKTTTSTLIAKFLEKAGFKVWLGGNIGVALFSKIEEMKKEDFVVLELSSFQLMTMKDSPDISVITNISPNHLDYHKDYDEYIDSKANIFLNQKENNILVLNKDDACTKRYLEQVNKNLNICIRQFSLKTQVSNGVYLNGNNIVVKGINVESEKTIANVDDVKLIGMHNIANICAAASAVVNITGIEAIKEVITTFSGVEHRMEFVRNLNGVNWYNDSIGTSSSRTIAGLIAFKKKIILIAGGYDKNIPYDNMGGYILDKVKILILIGNTAPKIKKSVENEAIKRNIKLENLNEYIKIIDLNTMEESVNIANNKAKSEDIVVLSPASASFDLYKNFEERGNLFKKLVNELK